MKALPLLLWIAGLTISHAAPIAKLTTLSGKTYRQCKIVQVYPDGVSFHHANGAAKVLFTDLSEDWRTRLGYDAKKATAYQKELADKREAEKAARARVEEARFKALAEAAERARIQSLGQEAQARAAVRQQPNFQTTSVIPVLPALGAVHDAGGSYGRYDRPYTPIFNGGFVYPGYGFGYSTGFYTHGWGICPPAPPVCPPRRTFRVTITR